MKVYFISGLGADSRVFKHIQLPPCCQPVHLDWIPPEKNELLSAYALRLAQKIDLTEKFSLVGLSFGGMIAVEICRQLKPVHTILISSIPSVQHLPQYYRLAGSLRLHKIIPVGLFQYASVLKRLFTIETNEDKKMLKAMIKGSDVQFIRWAMNAALTWPNKQIPENLVQIHGSRDQILPQRFTTPTHIIVKGGHLMVLNRAGEINKVLGEILDEK